MQQIDAEAVAASATVQDFLLNPIVFISQVAVTILCLAFYNYALPYLRQRGKNLATVADIEKIVGAEVTKLKASTDVLHADWALREWKSVRKDRLPELLAAVSEFDTWESIEMMTIFRKERNDRETPTDRIYALTVLYFPELDAEIEAIIRFEAGVAAGLSELRRLILTHDDRHRSQFIDEHIEKRESMLVERHALRSPLNKRSRELMRVIHSLAD